MSSRTFFEASSTVFGALVCSCAATFLEESFFLACCCAACADFSLPLALPGEAGAGGAGSSGIRDCSMLI